jgi:hypothetical protein
MQCSAVTDRDGMKTADAAPKFCVDQTHRIEKSRESGKVGRMAKIREGVGCSRRASIAARVRRGAIGATVAVLALYAAAPYVTLYRLRAAALSGDAATLATLVDWDDVREGIKEDICDQVLDDPSVPAAQKATAAPTALPPFGASFVRGIASNEIDSMVTPQRLVVALRPAFVTPSDTLLHRTTATSLFSVALDRAMFSGPTRFIVALHAVGMPGRIRLQLDLRNGGWKVTRAWLPPDFLDASNAHT